MHFRVPAFDPNFVCCNSFVAISQIQWDLIGIVGWENKPKISKIY